MSLKNKKDSNISTLWLIRLSLFKTKLNSKNRTSKYITYLHKNIEIVSLHQNVKQIYKSIIKKEYTTENQHMESIRNKYSMK